MPLNDLKTRVGIQVLRQFPVVPWSVSIEPTKACNLKCTHCRRTQPSSPMFIKGVGQHFTPEQLKEVLDQAKTIQTINWIGDGEPLCNPHFNELIEIAAKKGKRTTFTTNGTLVTQELVNFWKLHRVARVSISMDSPNGEVYEKMRPGASFDKMLNAAKMIAKTGIYLQTSICFFAESLPEIVDYVRLSRDIGAKRIYLIRPHFVGTIGESESYTFPKNDNKTRQVLKLAEDIAREAHMVWYEPWYTATYFRSCMWPFIAPYINIGGNVQACCYMFGTDRIEHFNGIAYDIRCNNYIMGNMFEDNLMKIWHGDLYKELRNRILSTEMPRGSAIELDKLKKVKGTSEGRFRHCDNCLWRWGLAC